MFKYLKSLITGNYTQFPHSENDPNHISSPGFESARTTKQRYIEKFGYPTEDVTFSDYYGRMIRIIGSNTYQQAINSPVMKKIAKEIEEKGSCTFNNLGS